MRRQYSGFAVFLLVVAGSPARRVAIAGKKKGDPEVTLSRNRSAHPCACSNSRVAKSLGRSLVPASEPAIRIVIP